MSHEIHNIAGQDQFISLREPAWHGLGTVITEEIGAVDAGKRLKIPVVTSEPVLTASGLPTKHKAIIGTEEGGAQVIYDVVSDQYHEIDHNRFLECWDRGTESKAHVETLGLLYKGSTLFLTTQLPSFDVKGDEMKAFLLAFNPLRSGYAVTVRKTPVRVVCANTLAASGQNFTAQWRVVHTKDAAAQLEAFVKSMYSQAVAEYETVKDFLEILASKPLTDVEAKAGFADIYREPGIPTGLGGQPLDPSEEGNLKRLAEWERFKGSQIKHRERCFALYSGEGRGSMSDAAKGTAWGAYNAAVEHEQYVKPYRQDASVVFGAGRSRIVAAYNVFAGIAGMEVEAEEEGELIGQ